MRQVWRGFGQLPGAKLVRYKKKQSTLRDKFPSHSYTGDPTLSDKGFELLKGLLCYDPARRMTVPKLSTCVCVCVCVCVCNMYISHVCVCVYTDIHVHLCVCI